LPRNSRREDTWKSLQLSYRFYRRLPTVTGMSRWHPNKSGGLSKRHLAAYQARASRIADRLGETIRRLRVGELLPACPSQVRQATINSILRENAKRRLRPRPPLGLLWEALLLYRADYTCCYCGRNSLDVYRVGGKRLGLRMVVDHLLPVGRGGKAFGFSNCKAACWSCNLLKSSLTRDVFLKELRSLSEAVMQNGLGIEH
jgi:5-methylcytosine-specific restriction endonuclease McrA